MSTKETLDQNANMLKQKQTHGKYVNYRRYMSLLLTLSTFLHCFNVSIVEFEQNIAERHKTNTGIIKCL